MSNEQNGANPSTGTLMVIGTLALAAALTFIWFISP